MREQVVLGGVEFLAQVSVVLLMGTLAAGALYASAPKTAVELVKRPGLLADVLLYELYFELDAEQPKTPAEARKVLEALFSQNVTSRRNPEGWRNYLVGGRIREEDSPGNYLLRETGGRLQFVIFDSWGAEHVLGAWPLPE